MAWNFQNWPLVQLTSWNGPEPTTGTFWYVFASATDSLPQMCSGRMYTHGGNVGASVGLVVFQTTVVSFGAVTLVVNGK